MKTPPFVEASPLDHTALMRLEVGTDTAAGQGPASETRSAPRTCESPSDNPRRARDLVSTRLMVIQ